MRYILIPNDVQVMTNGEPWKDSDNKVMLPWSFARYLENIVLPDPSIGTGYKELKACSKVEVLFEDAVCGSYVGVEDADWAMLKSAVENPKGGGISSAILRQFLPFMDAIVEAKDKKPDDAAAPSK